METQQSIEKLENVYEPTQCEILEEFKSSATPRKDRNILRGFYSL